MNEKVYADSGLGKWFGKGGKGGAGGGGWDRYNTKGERIGKCGDGKESEGKPKCLSKAKAQKLRSQGGKKAIANAVKRKKAKDPEVDRPGTGNKPINVSNKIKKKKKNEGIHEMKVDAPKGYHWMKKGTNEYKLMKNPPGGFKPHKGGSESADFELQKVHRENRDLLRFSEFIAEKNVPNDPGKWAASKAAAKRKFDVYPSAYANAWAAKDYKKKGGTWRKEKKKS